MQNYNKAALGAGGGGVGAALAQIVVSMGLLPANTEMALTVILAALLAGLAPALGPKNRET